MMLLKAPLCEFMALLQINSLTPDVRASSSWTCFRIAHDRRVWSWNKFRMTKD